MSGSDVIERMVLCYLSSLSKHDLHPGEIEKMRDAARLLLQDMQKFGQHRLPYYTAVPQDYARHLGIDLDSPPEAKNAESRY